ALAPRPGQSASLADSRQHLQSTAWAIEEHTREVVRNRQDRARLLAGMPQLAAGLEHPVPAQLQQRVREVQQWLPGIQLLAVTAADGRVLAADGFAGRLDGPGLAAAEPLRSALAGRSGGGRGGRGSGGVGW